MLKSRIPLIFLFGAVILFLWSRFLSGFAQWLSLLVAALAAGITIGLFWGRRTSIRTIIGDSEPTPSAGKRLDFTAELLHTAVNEMREGVLVIDRDMRVIATNQAARDLFANAEVEGNARRLTELTRNPAVYDAFLDGVRGIDRAGVKVETYAPERKVFDLRVVPLRAAPRDRVSGAVGVFFDVTRLERLELIRQEFLSNVSHELRTPLTSIVALAETLEAGALNDQEHNRRFLTIIQKNATRMHHLIDDILELSAIEAGNVKVQPEFVKLRSLTEDVISSLSTTAESRKVELRNLVNTDAEVFADPHRLMQMLTNLVDNAIKFNREGGTVSIIYEADARDRISIEDSGEGIPSHHLDRLFERFYRVDRARSRELGGTGLGLAIVKHLAKAHDGEVTVQSRFGEGSIFTIELPRQDRAQPLSSISIGATV